MSFHLVLISCHKWTFFISLLGFSSFIKTKGERKDQKRARKGGSGKGDMKGRLEGRGGERKEVKTKGEKKYLERGVGPQSSCALWTVLSRAKKQNVHSKVSLHHFERPFGRALGDLYLVQVFFVLNPVYPIANTIRSKHYSLWVFTNILHWVNLISQADCSILQVRSRTLYFTCIPSPVLHSSIHMHSDSR